MGVHGTVGIGLGAAAGTPAGPSRTASERRAIASAVGEFRSDVRDRALDAALHSSRDTDSIVAAAHSSTHRIGTGQAALAAFGQLLDSRLGAQDNDRVAAAAQLVGGDAMVGALTIGLASPGGAARTLATAQAVSHAFGVGAPSLAAYDRLVSSPLDAAGTAHVAKATEYFGAGSRSAVLDLALASGRPADEVLDTAISASRLGTGETGVHALGALLHDRFDADDDDAIVGWVQRFSEDEEPRALATALASGASPADIEDAVRQAVRTDGDGPAGYRTFRTLLAGRDGGWPPTARPATGRPAV